MSLTDQTTPFRIVLPAPGAGDPIVEIDGHDIAPQLGALKVEVAAGRDPVVSLYGKGAGTIEGHGIVQAVVDLDARQAIAGFLIGIDAEELERVALSRPDLDNEPAAITRAMLAQLRDWAVGE